MKQKIAYFVCYSNLWIGAGAGGTAILYSICFDRLLNWNLIVFLFASTVLAYTFQRYEKIRKNQGISGPRVDWMLTHQKTVKLIMILAFLTSLYTSILLSFNALFLLPFTAVISFLYAFKIKGKNLRDIPFLKIFLIALVWALSGGLMCFIEDQDLGRESIQYSFFLFLYIIAITIPFDIRDIHLDEAEKNTIPQIFTIQGAKVIGLTLSIIAFFILRSITDLSIWFYVIGFSMTAVAIVSCNTRRNELYFSLGVDGLLLVLPLTAYLCRLFLQ